ncbi:MAG: transporter substrate-binding domain-containing protein, partial [Treponema sp.]|nr:transporter substrate-binding domain-containing protein [Treponema sp.]
MFLYVVTGCKDGPAPSFRDEYPSYTDYRDIPGVTEEEISAVRSLKEQYGSFVYGAVPSTETFYNEYGEIRGYSALLCVWLSQLFDIPFTPVIYEWDELIKGLENNTVDFTGELTATAERRKTYFMTDAIAGRIAEFDAFGDVTTEDSFPLIHVSFSTQNRSLEPVISIVQKALQHGAARGLAEKYNEGFTEYMRYKFLLLLSPEEKSYINEHSGEIPIAAEYDNYPVSFYNTREKQWQGIAIDVLKKAGQLTGLSFRQVNDENAEWPELLEMLENGEAALITELIRSEEREGRFLWATRPFTTDRYALLSKSGFRDLQINEVLFAKVGLIEGSAYAELFRGWFPDHANTVEFAGSEDAFAALEKGEVDVVMATRNLLLSLTNYHEQAGYKTNIVFDQTYESSFGFNRGEILLCSIMDKALSVIDCNSIAERWIRKTFDYREKLARSQTPWFLGAAGLLFCLLVLLVVIFYRNLHEGKRLEKIVQDRTAELLRQDELLHVVNDLATILLASDTDKLKQVLDSGIEMVAHCVAVDRVYVWQNTLRNNSLYYVKVYEWVKPGEAGRDSMLEFSYGETFPEWERELSLGKVINGPLKFFAEDGRLRLGPYGIKSLLVVPVFLQKSGEDAEYFWG